VIKTSTPRLAVRMTDDDTGRTWAPRTQNQVLASPSAVTQPIFTRCLCFSGFPQFLWTLLLHGRPSHLLLSATSRVLPLWGSEDLRVGAKAKA
jgi:hypothetical protein